MSVHSKPLKRVMKELEGVIHVKIWLPHVQLGIPRDVVRAIWHCALRTTFASKLQVSVDW